MRGLFAWTQGVVFKRRGSCPCGQRYERTNGMKRRKAAGANPQYVAFSLRTGGPRLKSWPGPEWCKRDSCRVRTHHVL